MVKDAKAEGGDGESALDKYKKLQKYAHTAYLLDAFLTWKVGPATWRQW
jgi:hypothetical protein